MAKSLRSKVKRDFRSKKREAGVYAATEAARLHRLNAKLVHVVSKDKDGDEVLKDGEAAEGDDMPGSCWLVAFGLLDPEDISVDSMSYLAQKLRRSACAQTIQI